METRNRPILGIIVPCYNEQDVIDDTATTLSQLLTSLKEKDKVGDKSFIAFIDDGSRDHTWERIMKLSGQFSCIKGLRLSGNRGHQIALIAGLEYYNEYADALISIDADLQDDVMVMEQMIKEYTEGVDIVYGVRNKRQNDTLFKRYTAVFFYKLMLFLGVNIIDNHADYRLTSRKVIEGLKLYTEENIFLRGIFPLMGFKSSSVFYERAKRKAGVSKYPFGKMLGFALDGITSFSIKPLRLVMVVGFLVFLTSLVMSGYILLSRYYFNVIPGWSSLILSIYFLGGIQLFSIGILGEYLGKIYREVKRRPRYFIETYI